MLALQAHEDGLHEPCGQPLDVSTLDEMEGGYALHSTTCRACQALAHARDEDPSPGQVRYLVQEWDPIAKAAIHHD